MTTTRFTFRTARPTEMAHALRIYAEPGSRFAKSFGCGWLYLIVSARGI